MISPKTDWTKQQPGWFRPSDRLPDLGQRVDFIFADERWASARCHVTYGVHDGRIGFQILGSVVDVGSVFQWRPVDEQRESEPIKPKRKWNFSPEERERRRQHMLNLLAKRRAERRQQKDPAA
jgi:hypothetical protein